MQKQEFIQRMREDLAKDVKHNKTSVERIAASFGITDKNTVKEFTELAIVLESRRLSLRDLPVYDRYMSIVELYNKQVTLSHRTSQSMLLQQYSTPAPIGFIAGIFCGMGTPPSGRTGFKSYFEPSAGNGLLTIAAYPETFIVNEIDDTRNGNLKEQGFSEVKKQDATKPFAGFSKKFDAIITNPPFGKVEPIKVNEFEFTVLDHVMCIRALDTMKDNGSAALIIGGHTAWDDKGRIQAGKNRNFFVYLHKYYNVIDCINIDGHKLYSRQGTAFNVRLILISGRKKVPGGFPPFYNANRDYTVFSFEELYNRVIKYIGADLTDKNDFTSAFELEAEALALELELMSLGNVENEPIKIHDSRFKKIANDKASLRKLATVDFDLLPKSSYNYSKGITIINAKSGLRHSLSNFTKYHNAVIVQKLDKIIERATFVSTGKRKTKDSKYVKGYYNFISRNVFVNGEKIKVKLTIRVQKTGKADIERFYHDHYETEKDF